MKHYKISASKLLQAFTNYYFCTNFNIHERRERERMEGGGERMEGEEGGEDGGRGGRERREGRREKREGGRERYCVTAEKKVTI